MTDSAISGPIPSPGKRVARIGVVAEEKKALAVAAEHTGLGLEVERERIWFERLPRNFLTIWEAMIMRKFLTF